MTGCRGSRQPLGSRRPPRQPHPRGSASSSRTTAPRPTSCSHSLAGARSTGPPSRTARDHRRGRRLPAGARHTRGGAPCAPGRPRLPRGRGPEPGCCCRHRRRPLLPGCRHHPRTRLRPAALPVARSAVRGGDGGTPAPRRSVRNSGRRADRGGRPGARADRARVVARGVRAQWGSAARRRSVLSLRHQRGPRVFAAVLRRGGRLRRGLRSYGGEDWEWAHRAWQSGAVLAHVPDAVAWHDGPDWAGRDGVDRRDEGNRQSLLLSRRIPVDGSAARECSPRDPDLLVVVPGTPSPAAAFVCADSFLAAFPPLRGDDGCHPPGCSSRRDPRITRLRRTWTRGSSSACRRPPWSGSRTRCGRQWPCWRTARSDWSGSYRQRGTSSALRVRAGRCVARGDGEPLAAHASENTVVSGLHLMRPDRTSRRGSGDGAGSITSCDGTGEERDTPGVWCGFDGGVFGRKLLLVRPTGESGAAGRPRVLSSGEPPPIWMLRVSAFWSSVGVLPFGFFSHCLLLVGVVWVVCRWCGVNCLMGWSW